MLRTGWRCVSVCPSGKRVGGSLRDFAAAAILPGMIQFGALPASALADVGAWAVVVFVALAVTRLVSGPATADALRAARS